jgi:hypothetical protein
VNLEHRHRGTRREADKIQRACNGRYSGNKTRSFRRNSMRKYGAVGMTRRVNAIALNCCAARNVIDDGNRKSDIVDVVGHGEAAAAVTRIPGEQTIRERARSVRINNDESLAIADRIQFGVRLKPRCVSAAAVKRHENREGATRARRHMNDVTASPSAVPQRELMISRAQLL